MKQKKILKHQAGKQNPDKPILKSVQQKTPGTFFNKNNWGQLVIILIGVFIIYSPILHKEFVNYDDDWFILNNPFIHPFLFSKIGKIFSEFYGGQYSPLPTIFLGFLNLVSGNEPFLYNMSAIVLHLVNVCLVCWLVFRLSKNSLSALVV